MSFVSKIKETCARQCQDLDAIIQGEQSNFPMFREIDTLLSSDNSNPYTTSNLAKDIILPLLFVLSPPAPVVELSPLPVPDVYLVPEDYDITGTATKPQYTESFLSRYLIQDASIPSRSSLQHQEYISKPVHVDGRTGGAMFDLIDKDGMTITAPPMGISTRDKFHQRLYAWSRQSSVVIRIVIHMVKFLPVESFFAKVGELPAWIDVSTWAKDSFPFLRFVHGQMSLVSLFLVCISHFGTYAPWTTPELYDSALQALDGFCGVVFDKCMTQHASQVNDPSRGIGGMVSIFSKNACQCTTRDVNGTNDSATSQPCWTCLQSLSPVQFVARLWAAEYLDFLVRLSSNEARQAIGAHASMKQGKQLNTDHSLFDETFYGTVVARYMSPWFVKASHTCKTSHGLVNGQLESRSNEERGSLGVDAIPFHTDEVGVLLALALRLINTWELTGVWSALSLVAAVLGGSDKEDIMSFFPLVKECLKKSSGLKNPIVVAVVSNIYLSLSRLLSNPGKPDTTSAMQLLRGGDSALLVSGLRGLTTRVQSISYSDTLSDMMLQEILTTMSSTKLRPAVLVLLYLLVALFRQTQWQRVANGFKEEIIQSEELPTKTFLFSRFEQLQESLSSEKFTCSEQHQAFRLRKSEVVATLLRIMEDTSDLPILSLASEVVFLYSLDILVSAKTEMSIREKENATRNSSHVFQNHITTFYDICLRTLFHLVYSIHKNLSDFEASGMSNSIPASTNRKLYRLLKACMAMLLFTNNSASMQVLDNILSDDEEMLEVAEDILDYAS